MKKILFWSAVTILAAVSCNKIEDEVPATQSNVPSFVASVDGAETKTVIEGMKSYWNGTEGIRVLDGVLTNGKVYTATVETMAQTATFAEVDNTSLEDGVDYLAVYPEGPAGSVTWDGSIANAAKGFWLPGDQTATLGSYDPSTHIAVAYAEGGSENLHFKNVNALVKVNLTSDNVTEICFYGNNSDVIAGNFNVTYNSANPTVSTEGLYNRTFAKVKAPEGTTLAQGVYYISVLPNTLSKGFSIETVDGTYNFKSTKKNGKSYTIGRNQIVDLGDVAWDGKIYLNAGGVSFWDQAGAWFSAYFMDADKQNTQFVKLTKQTDGKYVGDIPSGTNWKYVIFVRNNPADNVADWTNVWNQTADLEIQKGKNTYTISGWSSGDWS